MGESDSSSGPLAGIRRVGRFLGRGLETVDHGLSHFERIILSYGVLVMATNSVANVIGRFVFNQSIYFSQELNQFLMVLITFIGLGYATRQGRHIRMSAIYDQLPDLGKKILMIVIAATTAAVMFVLAWYSFKYVQRNIALGRTTPSLQIPVWITYIWVPIGFFVAGVQYVATVLQNLQRPEVYISYSKVDVYDESDDASGV